jgi:hypothetical protein
VITQNFQGETDQRPTLQSNEDNMILMDEYFLYRYTKISTYSMLVYDTYTCRCSPCERPDLTLRTTQQLFLIGGQDQLPKILQDH